MRAARYARRARRPRSACQLAWVVPLSAVHVVFLLLGVAGLSSLWLAILADDGITLLVLLNSLRLLSFKGFMIQSSP